MLTDAILGRDQTSTTTSTTRTGSTRGAPVAPFAKENAAVAARLLPRSHKPPDGREDEVERLAPGEGVVARIGGKHYAVSRDDDGELSRCLARCTHLGCIVGWNAADRAWECPCHGSRYAADGTLVQGPATKDLPSQHW